jgi:hypothetical protein
LTPTISILRSKNSTVESADLAEFPRQSQRPEHR